MSENAAPPRQYLTFTLDEELFALDSSIVSEVIEVPALTRIPRTPPFLRGVINLRGNAASIVDLRIKFGLGETSRTEDTCIIVVEREYEGERLSVGVLADSVREVQEFAEDDLLKTPEMGMVVDTAFIQGVARLEDGFITIFNESKLFALEELSARP